MHTIGWQRWMAAALAGTFAVGCASAQTVQLKRRASGSVTVTTQGQTVYAAVRATNADARALFQEIASKTGAKILVAPSVGGALSAVVESQPLEAALSAVAASGRLMVRKIVVAEGSVSALTAKTAAPLASALSGTLSSATVVDPATGRSVTLTYASTAPKLASGQVAVYYVMRSDRTAGASGDAVKDAVESASESLSQLSTSDRFQAVRDLQRQVFQSMTPEEREQMRQQMPQRGAGGPPPGAPSDGNGPPPAPPE